MIARGSVTADFENCKLKNVLYIPELSTNLLSVYAIESGGEVLFKNKVTISRNKTILKGHKTQKSVSG